MPHNFRGIGPIPYYMWSRAERSAGRAAQIGLTLPSLRGQRVAMDTPPLSSTARNTAQHLAEVGAEYLGAEYSDRPVTTVEELLRWEAQAWRSGVPLERIAAGHNTVVAGRGIDAPPLPPLRVSTVRAGAKPSPGPVRLLRCTRWTGGWYQVPLAAEPVLDLQHRWFPFAIELLRDLPSSSRHVLISGPSGTGKTTRLIPALVSELTAQGWAVQTSLKTDTLISTLPGSDGGYRLLRAAEWHGRRGQTSQPTALIVDDPCDPRIIPPPWAEVRVNRVLYVDGTEWDTERKLLHMFAAVAHRQRYIEFLAETVVADLSPHYVTAEQMASVLPQATPEVLQRLATSGMVDNLHLLQALKTDPVAVAPHLYFGQAPSSYDYWTPNFVGPALLYALAGGFLHTPDGRPATLDKRLPRPWERWWRRPVAHPLFAG